MGTKGVLAIGSPKSEEADASLCQGSDYFRFCQYFAACENNGLDGQIIKPG
jgi:hypothetical protein